MWIAAAGRNGKKLGLVSQSLDGKVEFIAIEDLRAELPFGRSASLRVSLQFNEHTDFPTTEYLAALGAPALTPTGQRCYEFATAEGPVVIPGQILVVALVGATTLMRAPLLSPQGPSSLVTAFQDAESGKIQVEPTPRRNRQFQMDRWSTVCRMQWVLQFPTATRAWSSVYANALLGLLDVSLPNAGATVIIRGVEVLGKFMVTSMDMLALNSTEDPHEFAQNSVKRGQLWTLIDSVRIKDSNRVASDTEQLSAAQCHQLAQASPYLKKLLARNANPRLKSKIQLIRTHIMLDLPFYMIPAEADLATTTNIWVRRLKKLGQWDEVESAIRATA